MAIAFGVFNAAALTVGGTYIIQQLLQIDFIPAALLFVSLTAIYSVIGGLWAVAYTEIVQGALAVAGILGITILFCFTIQTLHLIPSGGISVHYLRRQEQNSGLCILY